MVHTVVVDDGSSPGNETMQQLLLLQSGKLTVKENGQNRGVGYSLNTGINWLLENYRSKWILLLDQDTTVEEKELVKMVKKLNSIDVKTTGMVHFSNNPAPYELREEFKEVDKIMIDGSLVNADVLQNVKFREEFVVDQIDYDFCHEIRRLGYSILVYLGASMNKSIGKQDKINSYEPLFRMYYISRNSTILLLEGKLGFTAYADQLIRWSSRYLRANGSLSFVAPVISGIKDAVLRNMRYIPPTDSWSP